MIGVIAGLTLAAWVYLFFLHHRFWHGGERLPREVIAPKAWPPIVAIVPARDEAPMIGACIDALMKQNYPGEFSIIIVDDASTDGTSDVIRTACTQNGTVTVQKGGPNRTTNAGHRVEVIAAPPLLDGWTGKLSALNAGLRHAETLQIPPAYVWFTDADVVHPPETLTRLTAKAVRNRLDLVSLMVRLHCESFWERRLIPTFIYFFQTLYPFPAVNDPRSKIAAAAGGCVLLRRDSLRKAGELEAVSAELIDDCAIAGAIKRSGGRLWLGLSDGSKSLRTAESLGPLWTMVCRTAYTQLKYSPQLLGLTVAGIALIFLAPPVLLLSFPWRGHGFAALAGLTSWLFMIVSCGPTLKDYGLSHWNSFILPLTAAVYSAMTVDSAVAHMRRRGGQWKGRHYGPSVERGNLLEFP